MAYSNFMLATLALTVIGCAEVPSVRVDYPAPVSPKPAAKVLSRQQVEMRKLQYISISEKILFEFDKARLLDESKHVLDEVAAVLVAKPHIHLVEIEGHTDSIGQPAYNLKLSQDRAESVRDYLISREINPSRLTARGYGAEVPIADNDTDEGREKNRRVQFRIDKQDAEQSGD